MRVFRPESNIVSVTGRFLFGIFLLVIALVVFLVSSASAVDYPKLINKSLFIEDVTPAVTTDYRLSWRYPSNTTIGSIKFEMCTNALLDEACVNPGGDFSAAVLDSQSGVTGFNILTQDADNIILSRSSAGASTVQSTYHFTDVVNPGGLPTTFFVRIYTYSSVDATGAFNHASSVGNATTEPIVINSEVPPILYFCAGITISDYCDTVTGDFIDYGTLSAVSPNYGTSQFGVSTNALGGYVVTTNGDTMTSGNKTIAPLSTPGANTPGTEQFGLNLRANTDPATGQDAFGPGIGVVDPDYNTVDSFQYVDGDVVATGATGTLFNTYTVTYLVNITPDQAAGVYNTTIAYICTAAF